MKKHLVVSIVTMISVVCLVGCGYEAEHKITDPLPSKITVEDESKEQKDFINEKQENHDELIEDENSKSDEIKTHKDWDDDETNKKDIKDETVKEDKEPVESATPTPNPYAGLAVSSCHDVTVNIGASYNECMDLVIEGCKAYPNTFPVIDNVDFNTPGIYSCAWVRLMDDGTYLPLNYATFTVTVVDPDAINVDESTVVTE